MTKPAELFARLTGELEDLHGLTVEGQQSDQPPEVLNALVASIGNGLQRAGTTLGEIKRSIAEPRS
ncbi:hypothetical protein T8S45_09515 [Blastomonas marina]|uniref:hypothetical protein n=1 Tax=Blastomonas marina TaxID=1867408 RepID=UPI002AC98F4D|nr:hypothetical protein [Blastomonas marina]WPZ03079.1 hypothetical protein T8S45_09515 [Blastomonas marina]